MRAAEYDRDICLGLRAQRFHFDERIVVHETDAGQVFAPFARVAGHTFAHIVRRQWIRLEAYTVLALMILARGRLRVHHGNQWRAFAEFASEFVWAFAHVVVDAVDANASILAHVVLAVVNILGAVGSTVAGRAFARIVREMVDALGVVFAWIEVGAVGDFRFAVFAGETRWAFASVRFHAVDAGCVVLAFILAAVVDVHFATGSRVAGHATAAESSFFQNGAGGVVAARIAIASVNHEFAVFAMETRFAHTIVLALSLRLAHGIILTGERVAGIAFR